ncbi:MAG: hypothetical protein C0504_10150 [Candidatus Solibacter sp.]|nr:hypothetical protein [Candidatus Solibacter sp.]
MILFPAAPAALIRLCATGFGGRMSELSPEDERRPEDLLTRRSNAACLSETELEDFLHNRLSGATRECVEEHLLVCPACLERVEEEEQFAASFRTAARRIEDESLKAAFDGPRPGAWARLGAWLKRPFGLGVGLAFVGAAALLTLAVAPSLHTQPAMEITLRAERGLAAAAGPSAEAGRPLRLNLDAAGLPGQTLELELATMNNSVLLESQGLATGNIIGWELGRGLDAGTYWVRIYHPPENTLLREFALNVK